MTEKLSSKWSDLGVRTLSAVILVPLVLGIVWRGGFLFTGFVVALGILMAIEWVKISFGGNKVQLLIHEVAAASVIMGSIKLSVLALVILSGLSMFAQRKDGLSFWKSIGVFYIGLPVLALSLLRDDTEFGLTAVVWCMVIVWSADVMAYFFGRIIGGPKLAPRISPKKTWAGMLGAMVGAVLASWLLTQYSHMNVWPLAGLAAAFALVEQGGDIFESAFKRHYGVKDSGHLIPGHGGVLDRIDGLITVVLIAAIIGFVHNPLSPAAGLLHW
jgi:phosphatidate cytidylyltransferase